MKPKTWTLLEYLTHYSAKTDACVVWTGAISRNGYGFARWCTKKWSAHRLAWTAYYGAIPQGLQVCHTCDVPACINPAHLFLGTQAANMQDKREKSRQARGVKNAAAKLNDVLVRRILRSKASRQELAARYCVSYRTICYIKRRETWAHITC